MPSRHARPETSMKANRLPRHMPVDQHGANATASQPNKAPSQSGKRPALQPEVSSQNGYKWKSGCVACEMWCGEKRGRGEAARAEWQHKCALPPARRQGHRGSGPRQQTSPAGSLMTRSWSASCARQARTPPQRTSKDKCTHILTNASNDANANADKARADMGKQTHAP